LLHAEHESWLDRDHLMALDFEPDVVGAASEPLSRLSSSVAGCFLGELHPGGEAELGLDVGQVGLHGAR
jgi:hypothetical protein